MEETNFIEIDAVVDTTELTAEAVCPCGLRMCIRPPFEPIEPDPPEGDD